MPVVKGTVAAANPSPQHQEKISSAVASHKVRRRTSDSRIRQLAINTVRTLSMDAVERAKSGHPGAPMGLAPVVYTVWQKFLQFDPEDPAWPNRDRFVLSNGHASMLLYSMLYLTGVQD